MCILTLLIYSSSVASKVPHGESSFLMPADDHKDIIHTGLYILFYW